MFTPIVLKFYDDDSNVTDEFVRGFIPTRIARLAIELMQNIDDLDSLDDPSKLEPKVIDQIMNIVVGFFGEKFTVIDLYDHTEINECFTVVKHIFTIVSGKMNANPTPPGMTRRKRK